MAELTTRVPVDPKTLSLLELPLGARELVEASVSANTRRAYTSALKRFDESGHGTDDAGVAAYLTSLFELGRAPASAELLVAALRFRAKLAREDAPVGPLSARILAGFRRAGADRDCGQVTGVGWAQSDAAVALASRDGLAGFRDSALIAIGSDALLRVSELAALEVADIDFGTGTVTVRKSKTDQESEGAVLYLGEPTLNWVQKWLDTSGIEHGPLFLRVNRGGTVRAKVLSHQAIRQIIKQRANAAGVKGRVSGHSLRVGSAQSLAAAGTTLVEMQQAGRWDS